MSWRKPHYNCTAALKKAQVCAQHSRRLTQGPFFPMIIDLSLTVAAYLIGSLSAAILICRLLGLPDPRTQGSGNPGATTVLRFGGKKAVAAVATWLMVAKIFRISSLAALIAAILAPLFLWLHHQSQSILIMSWVMSLLLLWRHRGNIQRLITGAEGRIGR